MKQTDIRDFLDGAQNGGGLWNTKSHKEKIGECLSHFSSAGIPLSVCSDKRHLNRAISTLKRYAREFGLKFPDYVPMALRKKKAGSR